MSTWDEIDARHRAGKTKVKALDTSRLDWMDGGAVTACPYPEHRRTDWRLSPEHPWVCGICHPPAAETLVGERRGSDDV